MTVRPFLGFQDGKAPDALRTIGEVATAFNIRPHVLRYWEDQFPMLRPLTRAGGRRYYRPEDVALLSEISRLLYQEGFTIRGARQALSEGAKGRGGAEVSVVSQMAEVAPSAAVPARAVSAPPAEQVDKAMREKLMTLRRELAAALAIG